MEHGSLQLADSAKLLSRVSHEVAKSRRVTFLVGSAITAPGSTPEEGGVPDAGSLVEEVTRTFAGTPESESLAAALERSSTAARYQAAMQFMIECRGQDALNKLIQDSVLRAYTGTHRGASTEAELEALEMEGNSWHLRPGAQALGELFHAHPNAFCAPLLTSNFDPLLEVSLRRAGRSAAAIFLTSDGQFNNVIVPGTTKVVHFHGYWWGSDTLHTPAQLTRNRPRLKGALRSLLRETTLVVIGYGGWSDVFTQTLVEVINEQTEPLNVLWTFYSDDESDIQARNKELLEQFSLLSGRVVLYKGVDCHVFLPLLRDRLRTSVTASGTESEGAKKSFVTRASDEDFGDNPPQTDGWVGRAEELRRLLSSPARVVAINGMGGSGKSSLAAKYLDWKVNAGDVDFTFWADFREEANTIHTRLVQLVSRASEGSVDVQAISKLPAEVLGEALLDHLGKRRALLVFDNIDQYVDMETGRAVASMNGFIELVLKHEQSVQLVLTSRPTIDYGDSDYLQIALGGLSVEETRHLFKMKGVDLPPTYATALVVEAHDLTKGHVLALNLIATQSAKGRIELETLLRKLRANVEAGIELPIIGEMWDSLNQKQHTVLRYLAELPRAEDEQRVASYLGNALNYNQFSRAIRSLKSLNLVVVKTTPSSTTTLELHPLIRDFIRRRFGKEERRPFIDAIISFCDRMIGQFRSAISSAPYSALENWSNKIELCMQCGRVDDAISALAEVQSHLLSHGYTEEFIRLAQPVLAAFDPAPDSERLPQYDKISEEFVAVLSALERTEEAEAFLETFAESVTGKTARYLLLCKMRSWSAFLSGQYGKAKDWAIRGVELKSESQLDTQHDCAHYLALARRDSGEIDLALAHFLDGENLKNVVDPENRTIERQGVFFGNIGRCLYLQEKFDDALVCLKKSALLLEESSVGSERLMNQGWAASWIGETLAKQRSFDQAYVAFRRAAAAWKPIFPGRSREATRRADEMRGLVEPDCQLVSGEWECTRAYLDLLQATK